MIDSSQNNFGMHAKLDSRDFHGKANLSINIIVAPRKQSKFCVWKLETGKSDVLEAIVKRIFCLELLMGVGAF